MGLSDTPALRRTWNVDCLVLCFLVGTWSPFTREDDPIDMGKPFVYSRDTCTPLSERERSYPFTRGPDAMSRIGTPLCKILLGL